MDGAIVVDTKTAIAHRARLLDDGQYLLKPQYIQKGMPFYEEVIANADDLRFQVIHPPGHGSAAAAAAAVALPPIPSAPIPASLEWMLPDFLTGDASAGGTALPPPPPSSQVRASAAAAAGASDAPSSPMAASSVDASALDAAAAAPPPRWQHPAPVNRVPFPPMTAAAAGGGASASVASASGAAAPDLSFAALFDLGPPPPDLTPYAAQMGFVVGRPVCAPMDRPEAENVDPVKGAAPLVTHGLQLSGEVEIRFPDGLPAGGAIELGFIQCVRSFDFNLQWVDGALRKRFDERVDGPLLDSVQEGSVHDLPWYQRESFFHLGGPYLRISEPGRHTLRMTDQPRLPLCVFSRARHLEMFPKFRNWDRVDPALGAAAAAAAAPTGPMTFTRADARYEFTTWLVAKVGTVFRPLWSVTWRLEMSATCQTVANIGGFFDIDIKNLRVLCPSPTIASIDATGDVAIPPALLTTRDTCLERLFGANSEQREAQANAEALLKLFNLD